MSNETTTGIALGKAVLVAGLAAVLAVLTGCVSDGSGSFLAHDASGAVFVEWTRTGDDVAGSISATEVAQPQTGVFSSATQPAGQIKQQTDAFTGTVRGDSVRLQIGSPALGSRINGHLDGDTLELAIPLDEGVRAMRLKPASQSDYDNAAQEIRADKAQGQADAQARRVREQRAARADITRVATAFQRALDPRSSDDPCRYLTPELKKDILSLADATTGEVGSAARRGCKAVIRDSERRRDQPLYEGPQGVAKIDFTDSLRSPRIGEAGTPRRNGHVASGIGPREPFAIPRDLHQDRRPMARIPMLPVDHRPAARRPPVASGRTSAPRSSVSTSIAVREHLGAANASTRGAGRFRPAWFCPTPSGPDCRASFALVGASASSCGPLREPIGACFVLVAEVREPG